MILRMERLAIDVAGRRLLGPISAAFLPGDVWGIVGKNGVGKTTLLHTLAGLQLPAEGRVFLGDRTIMGWRARRRAQYIGLLLQTEEPCFPITAWETVMTGRYPHRRFLSPAQEAPSVQSALTSLQLNAMALRDTRTLSGGERQKVRLAALIAQNPQIYLLDEPTTHLDREQQGGVLDVFERLAREFQKTILLVLHDWDQIHAMCNRLLWIRDAQNVQIGPCQEIWGDACGESEA